MLEDRVTANFALSEFLISETAVRLGIDNTPPALVVASLRNILIPRMQEIRDLLQYPVVISSGYRSPALNKAIRGSSNSQHITGHACDFTCPGFGTPRKVAEKLASELKEYDQIIFEGGWVHVSFDMIPRKQALTAHFKSTGVSYTSGIT